MHPGLFVIAAIQRKANFRNRLLKNISTLNSMINQALEMQIFPAFWAFLATQGFSGLQSGLARPPSHWATWLCMPRPLLPASQAPGRMNKGTGLPVLTRLDHIGPQVPPPNKAGGCFGSHALS